MTAATVNDIIEYMYRNEEYLDVIDNLVKDQDNLIKEDITQELFLQLLEGNQEKIIQVFNEGFFKYYWISMVRNNTRSQTSPVYYRLKKYHKHNDNDGEFNIDEYIEDGEIVKYSKLEDEDRLNMIDRAIKKELERDPKFIRESTLFNMYYKDNLTYRHISKKTKIPLKSVWRYVKYAKHVIKRYCKQKTE